MTKIKVKYLYIDEILVKRKSAASLVFFIPFHGLLTYDLPFSWFSEINPNTFLQNPPPPPQNLTIRRKTSHCINWYCFRLWLRLKHGGGLKRENSLRRHILLGEYFNRRNVHDFHQFYAFWRMFISQIFKICESLSRAFF